MRPQLVPRFVQLMCSQSFTPCRGDTATRPVLWLTGSVSALAESLPQWAATRLNLSSTLPRNESLEESSTAHFLSAAKHGAHECGPGSTALILTGRKSIQKYSSRNHQKHGGTTCKCQTQRRPNWVSSCRCRCTQCLKQQSELPGVSALSNTSPMSVVCGQHLAPLQSRIQMPGCVNL